MLIGVTAVLFFLGLLPLEAIPEIPVDIDSKPFFIPLVLVALLPGGRVGIAIGLGVALGEFLRDMMEGYELDDPIGFVGYFLAFALTSTLFGKQPPTRLAILFASILCALVQAAIEASSFLLFGEESLGIFIQSTLGNTLLHGIVWGAIPAFFLVPRLHGRFEHYLGFPTKGDRRHIEAFAELDSGFVPSQNARAWAADLQFRYPSSAAPVLRGISFDLRAGEVLGLMGTSQSGKSTLCRIMAGVAPLATGGALAGRVGLGGEAVDIGYVSDNPAAMMTRTRAVKEVEASLEHLGLARAEAERRALDQLAALGIDEREARRYIWELPGHKQMLVALAAAVAEQPHVLILDEITSGLDASGLARVRATIGKVTADGGAVLLVDNRAQRQREWADRVLVLAEGQVAVLGSAEEVIDDTARLCALGLAHPPARRAHDLSAPHSGEVLLELNDVAFTHDPDAGHESVEVWRGLNLRLAKGEVLAMAGCNGAGKTTLAKLLGGLLAPQAGTIQLAGANEPGPSGAAIVLHAPSAFFSEPCLRAEIERSLAGSGVEADAIDERISQIAGQLGLENILDTDPGLLPPGSARIAQTGAMMARGAPVLVLDEVAPGLDPRERTRLATVVADFASSGGGVIVLDHDLDFLATTATRVGLIEGGRLRDAGPPDQAFAPDNEARLRALDLEPPSQIYAPNLPQSEGTSG
ncbi:MAG: ATP-binding cassette domain-containing protein [Erythrobacter sp.]